LLTLSIRSTMVGAGLTMVVWAAILWLKMG
jgi:hypothetical protein